MSSTSASAAIDGASAAVDDGWEVVDGASAAVDGASSANSSAVRKQHNKQRKKQYGQSMPRRVPSIREKYLVVESIDDALTVAQSSLWTDPHAADTVTRRSIEKTSGWPWRLCKQWWQEEQIHPYFGAHMTVER